MIETCTVRVFVITGTCVEVWNILVFITQFQTKIIYQALSTLRERNMKKQKSPLEKLGKVNLMSPFLKFSKCFPLTQKRKAPKRFQKVPFSCRSKRKLVLRYCKLHLVS